MKTLALWSLLLVACFGRINGQGVGTQETEYNPGFELSVCTGTGASSNCNTKEATKIAIDANWRWTHTTSGATNCYTGNEWNSNLCSTNAACTQNCVVEGINQGQFGGTYGLTISGNSFASKLVTVGPYSTNIGIRTYMLDASGTRYRTFNLLNQEFSFDVDVSALDCGLNGALYFVDMDADGGASKYPTNKAGAKYGTGYCDAQCPHDVKWINGEANAEGWVPSSNDANSGKGKYGICCAELDIWEANKVSQAFTTHPCVPEGYTRCDSPQQCGDNEGNHRYEGICDKDGCDFATYRMGQKTFYGNGSNFQVNTLQPFTVVTQFLTTDGTANGDLKEIRRFYVQNGRRIETPKATWNGLTNYDSITDQMCIDSKRLFGDNDQHTAKGGLKEMGAAMKRGMVLVLSLWDDHDASMLWLDSDYPLNADPSTPGVSRGPCARTSGRPEDVENLFKDATVKFSNVRVGPIGSTTGGI